MPPPKKLKRKMLMPEKLKTQSANIISDADGVTLYDLSTILQIVEG